MLDALNPRRYLIPFRSLLLPQIFCDTLIIGGGVAGLRAAISAAEDGQRLGGANFGGVIVLAKDEPSQSNTAWAQGGIAAVTGADDTIDGHVEDTLVAGAGLCDEPVVRLVSSRSGAAIEELVSWGMRFDVGPDGKPSRGREGGHALARILHSDGDATGRELMRVLWARAKATAGVRVFTGCFALDLITPPGANGGQAGAAGDGRPVLGAITHHPRYGLQMIWARTTILAAGGAGMLYRETTNPRSATADAVAMAYRAGADVADMSFVQFHPTALYLAGAGRFLISEAVRGAGAHLVDQDGVRFMIGEHELAELAPRDIVSRAIVRRIASAPGGAGPTTGDNGGISMHGGAHAGGRVFLDCRHLRSFASAFPGITAVLGRFDINPARDLIPIHPAAHYMIGGVFTDALGRTNLPGLLAAGEAACSGLHGANRLASNSLLEGLIFGDLAGRVAARRASGGDADDLAAEVAGVSGLRLGTPAGWRAPSSAAPMAIVSDIRPSDSAELDLSDVESSLRSAMWRNAGIERSGTRLNDCRDMIEFWARYTLDKIFDDPRGWQVQNMLLASWLVVRSAAWRTESRGCHWRADHPTQRPELAVHDVWRLGAGEPAKVPVVSPLVSGRAAE